MFVGSEQPVRVDAGAGTNNTTQFFCSILRLLPWLVAKVAQLQQQESSAPPSIYKPDFTYIVIRKPAHWVRGNFCLSEGSMGKL